jgi:hypothetical protein
MREKKEMKFNWIGLGFHFGKYQKYFCINSMDVELLFTIYRNSQVEETNNVVIEYIQKGLRKTLKIVDKIESDINKILLISGEEKNRKYEILRFITNKKPINIGYYIDNISTEDINPYILCTSDHINLSIEGKEITEPEYLKDTCFADLMCLFNMKEMAKILISK